MSRSDLIGTETALARDGTPPATRSIRHLRAARFRAAENHRWMLRAAITGVSARIAPDGSLWGTLGVGAEGKLDMDQMLTDPDEAADFAKKTKVDALAIAIGTSHGAYKFTKEPTGDILRIDRVKEIHARIPNTHLVMHGSSSVPQEWLQIINSYGGDMGQTYGVPVAEIVEGIKHGVRKVNIDTDLRMASTGSIRRHLHENTANFDPRKFLKESTKGMKEICKARYEAFGCAGHASKIRAKSLESMFMLYASGELDPKIS